MVAEISAIQTYLGAQGSVDGCTPDDSELLLVRNSIAKYQTTTIKLCNATIPLADGPPGPAYGSKEIFEFEPGPILINAAGISLDITKSSIGVNDDWNGDIGLGTVACDGIDGLTNTEQNVLSSIPTSQAVDGETHVSIIDTDITPIAGLTSKKLYLNLLVDTNDHDIVTTPCDLIVNGFVLLLWLKVLVGD
jgi:hypothetical protein